MSKSDPIKYDESTLEFREIPPIYVLCRKCRVVGTRCQLYDDNPTSDLSRRFKKCRACGGDVIAIPKESVERALAEGYTYEPAVAVSIRAGKRGSKPTPQFSSWGLADETG